MTVAMRSCTGEISQMAGHGMAARETEGCCAVMGGGARRMSASSRERCPSCLVQLGRPSVGMILCV